MPDRSESGWGEATRLVHQPDPAQPLPRTVGPPIQRGSTVLMASAADLYDHGQVTYGRSGLAAQEALKAALCDLEHAQACELYPSGVAAIAGALLALLQAGDQVLVADSVYAPTRRVCEKMLSRYGVETVYYPARAGADEIMALAGPNLRLVVLESPGSLTFEIQDAPTIAAAARARGALTLIDNTWAAGLLFRPLDHGIDVSVQALTKYVCGSSDVFMGAALAADAGVAQRLAEGVLHLGWAVSPDEAYQALRGLRTLPVRLARHGESGLAVARWLQAQPEVVQVLHPALPGSPDHALWTRDFAGACGLFAFVAQPAPQAATDAFLDALTLFGLGFSWGGFESLAIPCDLQLAFRRHHAPLGGPLLRLHVGLEEPADLIADLRRGLDAFASS